MIFIILMIILMLWAFFKDNGIRKRYKCGLYNYMGKQYIGKQQFKEDITYYLLNSAIITFFVSGLLTFIVICLPVFPTYDYSYKFNINSMKDNLVTEGYIYYRSGHIDGELSYFFSRTMDKGEIIGHVPADSSYIKYDDDVHPNIEVHQEKIDWDEATGWKIFDPWLCLLARTDLSDNTEKEYIITVPSDTLTEEGNYEINME